MRRVYLPLVAAACLCTATPADASGRYHHGGPGDARLTISTPEATYTRTRYRHGIRTLEYRNHFGILPTVQWPLTLRFESRTAVGYAASATAEGRKREALVLKDKDGCLNLASLVADLGLAAFDPACAGRSEDEIWVQVQTEKFDTFELPDNTQTGNDVIQERLIDDDYLPDSLLNTPYLEDDRGRIQAVGPRTGGPAGSDPARPELDGYGYGADDDFASLVLIADIGGARVFDAHFDREPGVIRNLAGFVNTVSAEVFDGRRQTAITAALHPLAGVFEPIAIFDLSLGDPDYADYDYLHRVDSGDLVAFRLMSNVPVETDPPPLANEFYDELLSTYYPVDVTLRAVVVAREAPDYIHDLDQDGKFTARDVQLAGYELVSNEVQMTITLSHDNLLTESPDIKCLPRTVLFQDLDGDGASGEPFACSGKSGSSRSRRVPR
jgi:hypothetical protein